MYVVFSIWSDDVVPTDVGRTGRTVEIRSSRLGRRRPNASTSGSDPFTRLLSPQKDPVKFTPPHRVSTPHGHITNLKFTAFKVGIHDKRDLNGVSFDYEDGFLAVRIRGDFWAEVDGCLRSLPGV